MKKIILLFIFSCGVLFTYSQQVKVKKPQMEYKGYTINLIPVSPIGFGYDIVKDHRVVLHQVRNPFNQSFLGIKNSEDAFKVAMWQIDNPRKPSAFEKSPFGHRIPGLEKLPPAVQQRLQTMNASPRPQLPSRVPLGVARQLHVNPASH